MNGNARRTTSITYPLAPSQGLNRKIAHWQGGSHRQLLFLQTNSVLLEQWQPGITNGCLKSRICFPLLAQITGHMVKGEEQVVFRKQTQRKSQFDLLVPSGSHIVMKHWTGDLGYQKILARATIDALQLREVI